MKFNKKNSWKKLFLNKILIARFKLSVLFILGFLIGIMLKSQASRAIVAGYDDSKIFKSDEIQLEDEVLETIEKNINRDEIN